MFRFCGGCLVLGVFRGVSGSAHRARPTAAPGISERGRGAFADVAALRVRLGACRLDAVPGGRGLVGFLR